MNDWVEMRKEVGLPEQRTLSTEEASIPIHFGADPEYLIRGLSSDISTMECIFDLIDNSIDAARNEILSKPSSKDVRGLPASYAGFHIDVRLSDVDVIVSDDCSGMNEYDLTNRAFRTGAKSQHPYGIGHFGVGLKRAIFKLGKSVDLRTDNGAGRFHFDFTEANVLEAGDNPLFAARAISSGKKGNSLKISDLHLDVAADIGSTQWINELSDNLHRRYGIFSTKGLEIRLNGQLIKPFGPAVRTVDVGPVKYRNELMQTPSGVRIFAEAGLHEGYRIKALEADCDESRHRLISGEQGWYVVCNDRIILVADMSERTGWTTGWHNEYAGFLGWVHYVAEDPELLPWDSKKSGVNASSDAHRRSVAWLKEIADQFRAQKNKLRNRKGRPKTSQVEPPNPASFPTAKNGALAEPAAMPRPSSKTTSFTHSETHTTLFHQCEIKTSSPKVRSLADEAMRLEVAAFPYSAAFLLRAFFEVVLVDYLKRKGYFGLVKQAVFEKQAAQDRPFTDAQKKNFSPTLDHILDWALKADDVFPEHEARTCRRGCENFKAHVKRINGIVHEDGVLTGAAQVTGFRNDVLPTLRILLEN